ncbi:hypothetical protein Tco_1319560 [Tanacetum coccineum]
MESFPNADYILIAKKRLCLNKTQGASTPEEVKRMQNVLYASVVVDQFIHDTSLVLNEGAGGRGGATRKAPSKVNHYNVLLAKARIAYLLQKAAMELY